MAIGTITLTDDGGRAPSAPVYMELISFPGDGTYSSGGSLTFQASVRTALGRDVTLLAVIPCDCGGYVPVYDQATDALIVYEQTDTATSPLIETATANLSGTTFKMVIVCK